MTLLVSRKENVAQDLTGLPTAFRQVENWANAYNPTMLSYAVGWAGTANAELGALVFDPFGFVHSSGNPTFAGTLGASTSSVIATIPTPFVPNHIAIFPCVAQAAAAPYTFQLGRIVFTSTGFIEYQNSSGGGLTDFNVTLSYVYDPRI
jgi:hypothetical protein